MSFGGFLKQSTAVDVLIGPFVDSTDGDTEETALTIAQSDVRLSKNGQTSAQKNDVTSAAHDADGFYNCELDATDTNTVGQLALYVHVAGALVVRHDFQVMEEATHDALFGSGAAGFDANGRVDVGSWLGTAAATPTTAGVPEVDVTHLGGAAQSATDLKDFADAGYDPATNKVEGVKLADTTTTNTDMRGTDSAATAAALATVDSNVDAILDDTGTNGVVIGTGAISSTSFAAGAIDAAALSADAVDAILDETIGDGTLTMRETLRVCVAALAGKLSGAATTTVSIRNDADTANVIVATVDADGNRSAVTLTP